tara:strand:+ start:7842 stop:8666 length:825 start_codon:yes stop_codon:yes gene_type:complete
MSFIPKHALKVGAESLNKYPAKYGKIRVAGSNLTSYYLHSKGGCMPGQALKFRTSPLSKPDLNAPIIGNNIINSYRKERIKELSQPIGIKYNNDHINCFTYDEYCPIDDDSLKVAITAAYRQIYGNLCPMESERSIELDRKLRNGDFSVREYIRELSKSPFYRYHFFEKVNQQRSIELNIKHILGRAVIEQNEIIQHIEYLTNYGFEYHIDNLIDSDEYSNIFGDNTVPYMRSWSSHCGLTTKSYSNSIKLCRAFATSDNTIKGKSVLVKDLIK